jgi:hypothetical protein
MLILELKFGQEELNCKLKCTFLTREADLSVDILTRGANLSFEMWTPDKRS